MRRSRIGVVAIGMTLVACAFPGLEPEREPPPAGMPRPIGPVVEIGTGEFEGVAWRYSIYESTHGICTRLEAGDAGTSEACGGVIAGGPEPIALVGVGTTTDGPSHVEGHVSDEVAGVWIETHAGSVAATLMSLAPVGLDGQAFIAYVPRHWRMRDAVAVNEDRHEIGRAAIDVP